MRLIVPLLSSKVSVGPEGGRPLDWSSWRSTTVLKEPWNRAVISAPVEWRAVQSCFLQDHEMVTPLN